MFEEEATQYALDWGEKTDGTYASCRDGFIAGAEFGYNKANEWHYVENEGTPTKEGHYLVCLRDKAHSILDCWIWFDKDIGWYSLQVRLVDIFAWKEIVLPKEIE